MTSVCPFQEKRIVNMAIVTLPIKVMILVSLVRLLFYAVCKRCQHQFLIFPNKKANCVSDGFSVIR